MTTPFVRRALLPLVAAAVLGCAGTAQRPGPSKPAPMASMATPTARIMSTAAPTASVAAGEPWIVYQGGTGGPARIRLVRPDGTEDHELTPGEAPGEQSHPDWSRD
ncbi:MAG TPA: hypothetical protein VF119_01895, partial [Candidatus Limnocylindrales bacterium]